MKIALGLCWTLGMTLLSGQEGEKSVRKLRILPVGESPPFRQEIRDGVRYEVEAPKGSEPPYKVQVLARVKSDEEDGEKEEEPKPQELSLRLNRMTEPLKVPAAAAQVGLLDGTAPWHQFEMPEGGDMLAVFWRDAQEGDWGKARSLVLKDGPTFKAGSVRFVNVCPARLAVQLGDKKEVLKPGEVKFIDAGVVDGLKLQMGYEDARRGWTVIYSASLSQGAGQRSTYIAYRADGVKPRKPVAVVTHRESAVPLEPPPARAEEGGGE